MINFKDDMVLVILSITTLKMPSTPKNKNIYPKYLLLLNQQIVSVLCSFKLGNNYHLVEIAPFQ